MVPEAWGRVSGKKKLGSDDTAHVETSQPQCVRAEDENADLGLRLWTKEPVIPTEVEKGLGSIYIILLSAHLELSQPPNDRLEDTGATSRLRNKGEVKVTSED